MNRFVLWLFVLLPSILSATEHGFSFEIVESGESGIVIDVKFDSVSVTFDRKNGQVVGRVSLPYCRTLYKTGFPELPADHLLLGIPATGEPHLSVLSQHVETKFIPMQTIEQNHSLSSPADASDWFPMHNAQIGSTALIRNQRVVTIQLYPVRYQKSTHRIQILRSMRLGIHFDGVVSREKTTGTAADHRFDPVYRNLLDNYETSRSWRIKMPAAVPLTKSSIPNAEYPRYRIEIHENGVYAVTGRELANAGADITEIDPGSIVLYNRGEQVPLYVTGKSDAGLHYDDQIIFIGEHNRGDYSYNSYFSDTNVYILSWGQPNAQRFAKVLCTPYGTETDTLKSSKRTIHLEKDTQFRRLVGYREETQDHWFWHRFEDGVSYDFEANLPGVNNAFPLRVKAAFYGLTSSSDVEIDHHVVLYLAGERLGDAYANGMLPFQYKSPEKIIPNITETSILKFEMPGDLDVPADHVYFNWASIEYTQNHKATEGLLQLNLDPSEQVVQAEGFSDENVLMLTRDGRHFVQPDVQYANHSYRYVFRQPSLIPIELYMVEPNSLSSVTLISREHPSDLKNVQNRADYVIITHSDFIQQAQKLADFRSSQGFQTLVADIQEVYDEFSDGLYDPRAIRRFLKYAYENWRVQPVYVLLMGDTTYEMDKWLHKPDIRPSFVPSMMQYTETFGFTSSDNYFACVAGEDILPDMFIGRLPVASSENAGHMVQKIIDYETSGEIDEWRRNICLATGDEDFFDLCGQHAVDHVIPDRYKVNWASTRYTSPYYSTTEDLINWLNSGQSVITFIVHGASEQIADKRLLHVDDMPRLTNRNKYPFGIALSCYLSHFDHPTEESFGEKLLIAENKGLLALFGSVGKSYQYIDFYLNEALFDHIFSPTATTLGEIITKVKYELLATSTEFWEPVVNYVLLGDPASRLQLTRNPVELNFSDKVLTAGETLTVSGRINDVSGGTLYCSVWTLSDSLLVSRSLTVTNGQFSGNLISHTTDLAEALNRHDGVGVVRAYFTNGTVDAAGSGRFGLARPLIDSVYTVPKQPQIGDSVNIVLEFDPDVAHEVNGIDSITLYWSVDEQNWQSTNMSGEQVKWTTDEPLVQQYSRQIYYKMEVISGNGNRLETRVYSYRVNRRPDLRLTGKVRLVHHESPQLKVPVENAGESACGEFSIQILQGQDTRNANMWIEDFRIKRMPAARDSVIYIPTPELTPGDLDLVFILDSRGEIKEERESNNVSTAGLLIATNELGTPGLHYWSNWNVAIHLNPGAVSHTVSLDFSLEDNDSLLKAAEQAMLQPMNGNNGEKMIYRLQVGDGETPLNGDFTLYALVRNMSSIRDADIRWFAWNFTQNGWTGLQTERSDSLIIGTCPAENRIFGLMLTRDNQGPFIHVGVEGQNFVQGDLVNRNPTFTFLLEDSSGIHVDPSQIFLSLDGSRIADQDLAVTFERKSRKTALLTYSPELTAGPHQLGIRGKDVIGNETFQQVDFKASSEFSLEFLANHPNPFYEGTTFAFLLTDMARVTLKVFTASGKHIRTFERMDVSGYQEISWDGRDEWGNELANGVYYLKFTAEQGSKKIERIVKLAKLR